MDRSGERKFTERARKPHSSTMRRVPGAAGAPKANGDNRLRSESLRAVVFADDATVRWSEQELPDDPGCVRATLPVPRDVSHFCFEVTIIQGEDIRLGLARFEPDGKIKSDSGYAYRGKSGLVFIDSISKKYNPFNPGDVVACGVSFFGHSVDPFVFFARNGEMLEPFLPWHGKKLYDLYPFVATCHPGASVKMTFDETIQLKWGAILRDVDIERERKRLDKIRLHADLEPICERVVRDFLLHHGYVETLKAMDDDTSNKTETTMEVEEEEDDRSSTLPATSPIVAPKKNENGGAITPNDATVAGRKSSINAVTDAKAKSKQQPGVSRYNEQGANGAASQVDSECNGKTNSQKTARKRSATDALGSVPGLNGNAFELAKERRKVRTLVLEGRPVEAMRVVEEKWPDVLASAPVGLDLRVQCLVELIMARQYREAIMHARTELWPYLKPYLDEVNEAESANVVAETPEVSLVKRALGLFALPDLSTPAAQAKLSYLDRKRAVADTLNRVLLFHPNPPKSPAIERIITKLNEFHASLRDKAGGYGVPPGQEEPDF